MKRILILSGPTHEYFDPVRFVGNASSGRMGKAIAEEARRRGYVVEFVTGPVPEENLPDIEHGSLHRITSAAEMLSVASRLFQSADAIIFAAAVADYTPLEKKTEKTAKTGGELVLRLQPTPDISQTLCADKRKDQAAIGFALQTSDGEIHARRKLEEKHLDGIVLNTPASLGAAKGTFSFLAAGADTFENWGTIDKTECAKKILATIYGELKQTPA